MMATGHLPILAYLGFVLTAGAGSESADRAGKLIEQIIASGPKPILVQQLIEAGPAALEATRAARARAADPETKQALGRAASWQLARKVVPTLRDGFLSQLIFAGQYLALKGEGPEVIDALLCLIEDASTGLEIRVTACRALADVVDRRLASKGPSILTEERRRSLVGRLGKLYRDVLLDELLRHRVGILLATLGDTRAVDSQITRSQRLISSPNPVERRAHETTLAELYYEIRSYGKAVKIYEQMLGFYERLLADQKDASASREVLTYISRLLALNYYNGACSAALDGNIERAKEWISKAVSLDPQHFGNMEKDGDLANLRGDPGYAAFREKLAETVRGIEKDRRKGE